MQNRKQLEKDIGITKSFKGLAEAYEEVSVKKMQLVRGKVLATREFLDDVASVFADVKSSYKQEIEAMIKHKKGHTTYATGIKNGRDIAVLLSANNKLYGDIGKKVFHFFVEHVANTNTDIYIIGKIGKEYYDRLDNIKVYKYMDFPETKEAKEKMSEVIKELSQYETVNVYYGRFTNIITQSPVVADVTGTRSLEEISQKPAKQVKFFFEPSIESVLSIFENQIFGSLFRQTINESELSHVASRVQQMETALANIETTQAKLAKKRRLVIKRLESKKRLQRLSGMRLWK